MRRISSATATSPETGEFYWMRITSFKPGATISIDSRVTYTIDSLAGYFVDKNGMPWKRVEWTGTVAFELGDDPNEEYPGAVNPPGTNTDASGNPFVRIISPTGANATADKDGAAQGGIVLVGADDNFVNARALRMSDQAQLSSTVPGNRAVQVETAGLVPTVSQPAAATQASASKVAVANVRHIAKKLTINLEAVAAQADIIFNLRDGASGAGAILWTIRLALAAGQSFAQVFDVGNIPGSINTAMTLESAAAPAATNFASVVFESFDAA